MKFQDFQNYYYLENYYRNANVYVVQCFSTWVPRNVTQFLTKFPENPQITTILSI